jgi:hypothetical protein
MTPPEEMHNLPFLDSEMIYLLDPEKSHMNIETQNQPQENKHILEEVGRVYATMREV